MAPNEETPAVPAAGARVTAPDENQGVVVFGDNAGADVPRRLREKGNHHTIWEVELEGVLGVTLVCVAGSIVGRRLALGKAEFKRRGFQEVAR
jgi:hypothetical protein